MASRFTSNLLIAILAGALVALSLSLRPSVTAWVALGVGAAVVTVTAVGFLARDRGTAQRALDAPLAVLGAWTIIASRVLSGPHAVRWLSFAEAIGFMTLAVVGLIVHEADLERRLRGLSGERVADEVVLSRRTRAVDMTAR